MQRLTAPQTVEQSAAGQAQMASEDAANRRRGNSCENPGASAAAHRCHHTQVHAGVAAVSAGFDNTTAAADPTSLTTLLTPALNRKGGDPLTLKRSPLTADVPMSVAVAGILVFRPMSA